MDRPRLYRRLDAGVAGHLTVVVGPPGAGKTALLASWARSHVGGPRHTAWLTLDAEDNDSAHLFAHLEAALGRIGVATPATPDGFERSEGEASVPALLNAVTAFQRPVVLVLDGVHELHTGPALNSLLQFTRYAPACLRVVMASRREPELPLHKLRALGDLTEIRGTDLAFTQEEATALFHAHGTQAQEQRMARVIECSGGWSLAVRYAAAQPMRDTSHKSCLEGWSQAIRSCSDFLISELLEPLPVEHQDVLLRTSVLTEFSASLVRALTGRTDVHRTLRMLATVYDLLDRDDEWTYRLPNPLIRGVLCRELVERCGEDEVVRLLRTASDWYEEAGHHSRAREHAQAAKRHAARSDSEPGIVFPPFLAADQAQGRPSREEEEAVVTSSPAPLVTASPVPALAPSPVPVGTVPARPSSSVLAGYAPGAEEPLTPTELDVLRLLPLGWTLDEIAVQRHVSLNTIKTQVRAIYRKLGVSRRRDALVVAAARGML
ncbi:AAA family ATPase [Streptomyces sp. NPDC006879]|uniref:helix-turn-helix transcriptional regulator n=1 Tax=Streptomyces sp. NPDC006879 TaxID=3364767 RepID=UPI0036BD344F